MSEITIEGPAGRLEAKFARAAPPEAPVALILHPHPLHGGTMTNKVVFALHQGFHRHGFATLRINFRGVGRSQGDYDEGEGETADALAALDWLRAHRPAAPRRWIAGFSFGAWIALRALMERSGVERFVAVAPPVNLFDFSFLAPCPAPGLILQGSHDALVPEPAVARFAHSHGNTISYQRLEGADHFFDHHRADLGRRLDAYLQRPDGG
ncbi:MAG: alpha/beta fold hydrolase [Rhodospirillaceae bacterium]